MAEPTTAPTGAPASTPPAPKPKSELRETLSFLVKLAIVVFIFRSFFFSPFSIPSQSMLPRLLIGDYLFITKWNYGYSRHSFPWSLPLIPGRIFASTPNRGDVVVFKAPPGNRDDYIKRVIGLPGDTLAVRGGTVILNGKPITRGPLHYVDIPVDTNSPCSETDYYGAKRPAPGGKGEVCHLPIVTETLPNGRHYDTVDLEPDSPGDNYGPVTIPANHVFLMGDNRDRSADSRFPLTQLGLGGPVPYENLGGRAEFLTFSLDGDATLNPLTWWGSLRSGRAGLSLHPAQTH